MKKLSLAILIAITLPIGPVQAKAQTAAEIQADLKSALEQVISLLMQKVVLLQAQLTETQNAKPLPSGAPVEGIETPAPAPVQKVLGQHPAPIPASEAPAQSITLELLKTPKVDGGSIVWVPKKDGEVMRQPGWEQNGLRLFSKAEILLDGKVVRTYLNTKLDAEPWAQDAYNFYFQGTTPELKDSVMLRVTIDGETVSVNVPVE
ncbi:MAG TPA: hypothetical protein VI895_08210 [Bdellovibrionota bacterium]|nr:hypothetical protein [Bdellovibrionota bacterium]